MGVSVVIPAFNSGETICRAIQSALSQPETEEVIVVDDGSTDDTVKRCLPEVRVIRQENLGPLAARNRGIREARGYYVALLDSDDFWYPGKLAKQIALLRYTRADLCYAWVNKVDRNGQETGQVYSDSHDLQYSEFGPYQVYEPGKELFEETLEGRVLCALNQTAVFKRSFRRKAVSPLRGLKYIEDWDQSLRYTRYGTVVCLAEPVAVWRMYGQSRLEKQAANGVPLSLIEISENACLEFGLSTTQARKIRGLALAWGGLIGLDKDLLKEAYDTWPAFFWHDHMGGFAESGSGFKALASVVASTVHDIEATTELQLEYLSKVRKILPNEALWPGIIQEWERKVDRLCFS